MRASVERGTIEAKEGWRRDVEGRVIVKVDVNVDVRECGIETREGCRDIAAAVAYSASKEKSTVNQPYPKT
jgi:hypothetical protein